MADSTDPKFTPYIAKEGDRFDIVAYKAYGDPNYIHTLIQDNPQLQTQVFLPAGALVYVRIKTDPITGAALAPWFMPDEVVKPGDTGLSTTVPVTDVPVQPLAFAAGFPKVVNNKIIFAINNSGRYTYSVERTNGVVFTQSSGYDFSASFPLETPEISEGGDFIVKVGTLVSDTLTVLGSSTPLAWVIEPYFARNGDILLANFSTTKSGSYQVRITNTATNTVVYDQQTTLTKEQLTSITVAAPGTYLIEVGTGAAKLSKTVSEIPVTETTTKPDWLTKVGITINVDTRDTSIQAAAAGNIELRIVGRGSTPNTSGIGWLGVPWSSDNYIPGTTDFVDTTNGYTEIFRANGSSSGVGGLVPGGTYRLLWRLESDRGNVYSMDITVPSATVTYPNPPQVLPFPVITPPGDACSVGPTVLSLTYVSATSIKFLFNGNGILSIIWRIVNLTTNAVVRNNTVVVATPNGSGGYNAVFSPSNQPLITFDALPDGSYELQIEGGNCSSPVSRISFTIATTAIPVVGEPGVIKYTTSARTYRFINSEDARAVLQGDGTVKIYASQQFPVLEGGGVGELWMLNGFYCRVPDAEKNALIGAGYTFPKAGAYHYPMVWVKSSMSTGFDGNYNIINGYNTFGNEATARTACSAFRHVIIEITDL